MNIDLIKKEFQEFAEDPIVKLEFYVEEFKFTALKFVQGVVEDLDYNLTMELDKEYVKREPVIFTPEFDVFTPPVEEVKAPELKDEV